MDIATANESTNIVGTARSVVTLLLDFLARLQHLPLTLKTHRLRILPTDTKSSYTKSRFECKLFRWKGLSNKFLFEMDKHFSLRFNVTFHWIQIDILIVVNKYLIDSIKKIFNVHISFNQWNLFSRCIITLLQWNFVVTTMVFFSGFY